MNGQLNGAATLPMVDAEQGQGESGHFRGQKKISCPFQDCCL
jgi:hypothetical protein